MGTYREFLNEEIGCAIHNCVIQVFIKEKGHTLGKDFVGQTPRNKGPTGGVTMGVLLTVLKAYLSWTSTSSKLVRIVT